MQKKKKKLQTKRFTFIFIVSSQSYAVHEKVSIQLLFPSTLPITKVEYPNIIWWGHMFNSLAQIGWYNRTGQQIYNKGFILVFLVCVCVLTKVSYNLKDTSVHHNLSIAQYMMLVLSTVFSTFDSSIPTISVISLWSFSPLPSWEEQHASSLVKY